MNKIFVLTICFFILLNVGIKGSGVVFRDFDPALQIAQNTENILYVSSLCMLPVKIMGSLTGTNILLKKQSDHSNKSPKKDAQTHNTSADFSIVNAKTASSSTQCERNNGLVTPVFLQSTGLKNGIVIESVHHPPGWFIPFHLLLIMCFILLPRAGIEDSIIPLRLNR